MYKIYPIVLVTLIVISGCKKEYPYYDGIGQKPVYISHAALADIRNLSPQPVQKTGTIFLRDTLLFMIEQKRGIHVFNVSDTSNPVNLTFIQIPAVSDFTISGNTLYADNGTNLVTIDLSYFYQIIVISVQENVFHPNLFPPLYSGYFECADEQKGVIVDWIDTLINDAKCRITN